MVLLLAGDKSSFRSEIRLALSWNRMDVIRSLVPDRETFEVAYLLKYVHQDDKVVFECLLLLRISVFPCTIPLTVCFK